MPIVCWRFELSPGLIPCTLSSDAIISLRKREHFTLFIVSYSYVCVVAFILVSLPLGVMSWSVNYDLLLQILLPLTHRDAF